MNELYFLSKDSNESLLTSFRKRDKIILLNLRRLKEEVFKTEI